MTTGYLTDAEREELSRLFGFVPEPEPLEQMLAAVERILADRIAQARADERERIAQAIEAEPPGLQGPGMIGRATAARIARQEPSDA